MSEDGSYASLNFPYRLLAFFPGSRMDQDYVLPYTAGGKFSAFSITRNPNGKKVDRTAQKNNRFISFQSG
ncbi:MAG: hypothetical protein ACLR8P_23160 [Clostridium fessum]